MDKISQQAMGLIIIATVVLDFCKEMITEYFCLTEIHIMSPRNNGPPHRGTLIFGHATASTYLLKGK